MTTSVQVFLNVDRDHWFGWEPGHPVVRVFAYDTADGNPEILAEEAFAMFNGQPGTDAQQELTDAYYERRLRSLSVGDVLVIGGNAWACKDTGFTPLSAPLNDVTDTHESDGAVVVPLPREQEPQ